MRWLGLFAFAGLVSWQLYNLGYTVGLKESPNYARAISEKFNIETQANIERLEALASSPPSFEQCFPIVQGSSLDEYQFCQELLSAQDARENSDASDETGRLPRY